MKIYLTVGRGDGPTPLAAFDNAMYDAHVGNYNLVHLSSVIPPYSTIDASAVRRRTERLWRSPLRGAGFADGNRAGQVGVGGTGLDAGTQHAARPVRRTARLRRKKKCAATWI